MLCQHLINKYCKKLNTGEKHDLCFSPHSIWAPAHTHAHGKTFHSCNIFVAFHLSSHRYTLWTFLTRFLKKKIIYKIEHLLIISVFLSVLNLFCMENIIVLCSVSSLNCWHHIYRYSKYMWLCTSMRSSKIPLLVCQLLGLTWQPAGISFCARVSFYINVACQLWTPLKICYSIECLYWWPWPSVQSINGRNYTRPLGCHGE